MFNWLNHYLVGATKNTLILNNSYLEVLIMEGRDNGYLHLYQAKTKNNLMPLVGRGFSVTKNMQKYQSFGD